MYQETPKTVDAVGGLSFSVISSDVRGRPRSNNDRNGPGWGRRDNTLSVSGLNDP